jgi:transcriptional regulator with XRE-family HTH domain
MPDRARKPLTSGTSSEGRVTGYVFKVLRESLPRTQQQMADDLAVTAVTIQGWESGRRPMMAIPAGTFVALQNRLRDLGADPVWVQTLIQAVDADLFLGQILDTPHSAAEPAGHLLGSRTLTRSMTGLVGWPFNGQPPLDLPAGAGRSRRGPVADRPALATDERRHVLEHLRAVAERADRHTASGHLLIRQAYYLISFDSSPDTAAWLAHMHRTDRRAVRLTNGWSPGWTLARSTASALTRLGAPEPMREFLAGQLREETAERANLTYWGFWAGDLPQHHHSDEFLTTTDLHSWHGDRLLRHLLERISPEVGFLELNIHTLHALVRVHPDLITRPAVAAELSTKIDRLLQQAALSAVGRGQLESLHYGLALQARH